MRTRTRRNRVFAMLPPMLVAALGLPALGGLPEDLRVGVRVALEGRLVKADTLLADEIEIQLAPELEDKVKGAIQSVDPETRMVRVAGVLVAVSETTAIEDEADNPARFEDIKPGLRLKAEGQLDEAGVLRATIVKIKAAKDDGNREADVEGEVSAVDAAKGSITVLCVTVMVNSRTKIEID